MDADGDMIIVQNPTLAPAVEKSDYEPKTPEADASVDADTVNDATAFLETFFKLYPTATEKELAYYVSGNVIEPIGRDYLYSELVNPIFTKDGDNVKVKVAVKFLDNQTKATQVSQYELVLHKKTPNEYRMNEEFYPLQLRFDLIQTVKQKLSQQEMEENIRFATTTDIPACLELAYLVIDGFPNLNENEFLTELKKGILEQRVLILTDNAIAIALMSINYHTGSIDFFGVHPLYRKCGIAKLFLDKVMNELLVDKDISVTTFREGDKADTGYRKAYKELGFAEAELLVEFGYPTQKLVLFSKNGGSTNE